MKKLTNLLFILLLGLLLQSCAKEGAEDTSTEVEEADVIDNVQIGYVGVSSALGEFLINDPSEDVPIKITNLGDFEIRDIGLDFAEESLYLTFKPTADEIKTFPGVGGTCGTSLQPGQSCLIYLAYHPTKSGEYLFTFDITYMSASQKQVTRPMTLTARTGFPALLFISSGDSYTDWGVIEQTEPKNYISNYTITNSGELSAKDMTFSLTVSGGNAAYEIINNTCLKDILPERSCTFSVRHSPINNSPTDASVYYSSVGSISYEKDNAGTLGGVSFQVVSYSTLIQGLFEPAGSTSVIFTPNIINGNKETQLFKISNNGYRSGIPIEFIIKKPDTSFWATCKKSAGVIKCFDAGDVELTLAQFPFSFTDLDSCLESEVEGRTIATQGGSCFFQITYQPSITRTTAVDDTGTIISIKYDSLWKGQETIKNRDLFTIEATSQTPAKLELGSVVFNSETLTETTVTTPQDDVYNFYLGRLAKVTIPDFPHSLTYTITNTGDSQATLVSYKDGDGVDITNTPAQINNYYREVVRSGCDIILPGQSCILTLDLTTLADPGGAALELDALNDVEPTLPAVCSDYLNNPQGLLDNCYKSFIMTYNDSAQFYDDGSPMDDQTIEMRMSADLVAKAFLVYSDPDDNEGHMKDLLPGVSSTHYLKIDNIGTGPATYLRLTPDNDLKRNPWLDPTPNGWRKYINVVDQMHDNTGNTEIGTTGADYDCYALTDWDSTNYYNNPGPGTYDGSKILPAYESCVYRIDFNIEANDRFAYYADAADIPAGVSAAKFLPESYRLFQRELNNSMGMWEYRREGAWGRVQLEYSDGDINAVGPDSPIFGNFFVLDEYDVRQQWRQYSSIVPAGTFPTYTGFMTRPQIDLPALNLADYQWNATGGGGGPDETEPYDDFDTATTIPARTFFNNAEGLAHDYGDYGAGATTLADNLSTTMPYAPIYDSDHDYHLQLGTLPANLPYDVSVGFYLTPNRHMASLDSLNYTAGSANMTYVTNPTYPFDITFATFSTFAFNVPSGTAAGVEHGVVDYTFTSDPFDDNTGKTDTVEMQVMVELVDQADIPELDISFGDYQVNYDPVTDITSIDPFDEGTDYHVVDQAMSYVQYYDPISHTETIEAVKGSEVYAQKRIKIKNNSLHDATGMNIYLDQYEIVTGAGEPLPTGLSILNNTCVSTDVDSGDECTFDIKYEPNAGSTPFVYNIAIYHHIKNEQYTIQYARISLTPVSPASVFVVNTGTFPLQNFDNNWPDIGEAPFPTQAYVWNSGSYNPVADSHIILDAYPTVIESPPIRMANNATLAASFLKGIDPSDWSSITFDGAGYTLIYDRISDGKTVQIYANRACLVGDWAGDFATDPIPETAGFDVGTTAECYLKMQYHAYGDVIGDDLDPEFLIATLFYYNNKRASYDTELRFTLRGFVEGARSTANNGAKMVNMNMDSGQIQLEWPTFNEQGADEWGDITGYRIYWDTNNANLKYTNKDIFRDDIFTSYQEVSPTTYNLIRNLPVNRFYSFLVLPIRTIQGTSDTYLSASDLEIPILLSPASNHYYDYDTFTLIDTSILNDDFVNTKAEAAAACAARNYNILLNGSATLYNKSLITLADWEMIMANPADLNRNRTGDDIYPDQFDIWPHWTSEATNNAHTVFDPLGWNGSALDFLHGPSNTKLILDPDNPAGRDVNLLVGGLFDVSDRDHWVHPAYELGLARCRATVNPYHPFTEPQF